MSEKKYICRNCLERIEAEKSQANFPVFTAVSTAAGILGSFVTGAWMIVPISISFGLGMDTARCIICGTQEELYIITPKNDESIEDDQLRLRHPPENIQSAGQGDSKDAQDAFTSPSDSTNQIGSEADFNFDFPDLSISSPEGEGRKGNGGGKGGGE